VVACPEDDVSLSYELSLVPRLTLEVSPALVSFAELLMLPYTAMQSVVDEQLADNSALERLEPGECPICGGVWSSRCPVCVTPAARTTSPWSAGAGTFEPRAVESEPEALLRAVLLEVVSDDAALAAYLVGSLDRHGLFDRPCAALSAEVGVDESAVARVVEVIRRVGPPGIGATTVEECLLLQLEALELDDEIAGLAHDVIASHLPALARGNHAAIARQLEVSTGDVAEALSLIRRRLRPYPAFDGVGSPSATPLVVPDVVVREHPEVDGEFVVEVVEQCVTRLAVRRTEDPQPAHRRAESRARSFLAQLTDRWDTLRRVAEAVVAQQRCFVAHGTSALVPLTRCEIAAQLGLHESTVSRAVAGKYALLPDRSTVPLSRFFSASGGLDGTLRALVESANGPISDQRLAELLAAAGYPIARRTVAKHRARLGIAAAALR
jgi:RNA polymerase sigma-54 factor